MKNLAEKDIEFIRKESRDFITKWIGESIFDTYPTLSVLREEWSQELNDLLLNITKEYFAWWDSRND